MDAATDASPLTRFLDRPDRTVPLAAVPADFPHAVITLTVPGAHAMAYDPPAPGRLRGAFGRILKQSASPEARAELPCPWWPPSTLDVFFRNQGDIGSGLKVPKPFVLALTPRGSDLRIECTLFGLAADWSGQIADALIAAIRTGLRHPEGGRPEVASRTLADYAGMRDWPLLAHLSTDQLELEFLTPVRVRTGRQGHATIATLVTGLGNRAGGMARWMGCQIDADWTALKAASRTLKVVRSSVGPRKWSRTSGRQGRRVIDMNGFVGRAVVEGDITPLLPLLALGQLVHAGSHAALGMGRYRICGLTSD